MSKRRLPPLILTIRQRARLKPAPAKGERITPCPRHFRNVAYPTEHHLNQNNRTNQSIEPEGLEPTTRRPIRKHSPDTGPVERALLYN